MWGADEGRFSSNAYLFADFAPRAVREAVRTSKVVARLEAAVRLVGVPAAAHGSAEPTDLHDVPVDVPVVRRRVGRPVVFLAPLVARARGDARIGALGDDLRMAWCLLAHSSLLLSERLETQTVDTLLPARVIEVESPLHGRALDALAHADALVVDLGA